MFGCVKLSVFVAGVLILVARVSSAETNGMDGANHDEGGILVGEEEARTNEVERMRVDGVAAYVNKHVITVSDVMTLIEPVRRQLMQKYRDEALQTRLREAFDNALDSLVDRFLVLDAYEEQGGKIPEWAIDKRADEMIEELFGGDREALMGALKQEKMTYDEWRDALKQQMIVQSMRSANVDRYVEITPGQVRAYYEKHADEFRKEAQMHLRMIVVTPENVVDRPAREQKAKELVQRVRAGEDFALLAQQFSGGSHADQGGDWGWVEPTRELRAELAELAETTETGQVSEPLQIGDSFYVMKVEGRRDPAPVPLTEVYSRIERDLRQQEIQSGYILWIARLKENAFVKIVSPGSI